MSSQTVLNLVIGVAILGLLIYRQPGARPVRLSQRLVLALGPGSALRAPPPSGSGCEMASPGCGGTCGSATLVLYLAVTLGVQRLVVVIRAQRLDPAAIGQVGRGAI
jgi:hypothetical protein